MKLLKLTRKSCLSTAISPQLRIVPYKSIYLFIIVWVTLLRYYKSTRLPNCRWIFLRTAGDISRSFCGDQNCQFFTIRKIVSIRCCGNQSRFFFLTQTQWVLCIYLTRAQWKHSAVQHWQTLSCNIKKCSSLTDLWCCRNILRFRELLYCGWQQKREGEKRRGSALIGSLLAPWTVCDSTSYLLWRPRLLVSSPRAPGSHLWTVHTYWSSFWFCFWLAIYKYSINVSLVFSWDFIDNKMFSVNTKAKCQILGVGLMFGLTNISQTLNKTSQNIFFFGLFPLTTFCSLSGKLRSESSFLICVILRKL